MRIARYGSKQSSVFRLLLLVTTAASMGFTLACSDSPDSLTVIAPAPAPQTTGPMAVGYASFSTTDIMRDNRTIPIALWYPVEPSDTPDLEPAGYPLAAGIDLVSDVALADAPVSPTGNRTLIVFSHGYGGINTASVVLMETLASHGFIVASPEHVGNSQASGDDDFDTAASNRVPDVSLVIDALLQRSNDPDDVMFEKVSAQGVGVVGHSFGGMTAIGMAAGWAGAPADTRVGAIVPISAVIEADLQSDERSGPNAGFTPEQIGSITVPTMLIGGTDDINVFIENNRIAFEQLSAATAYSVEISRANHTHFANVCDIGNLLIELGIGQDSWPLIGAEALLEPYATTCSESAFPIEEVVRLQNLYVVSFFLRHLQGDTRYGDFLTNTYANREAAITFTSKND